MGGSARAEVKLCFCQLRGCVLQKVYPVFDESRSRG